VIAAALAALIFGAEPLDSVLRDTGLAPPRHGGVYVVAHRGAHEGIPENTLAAYRKAIELGCDFVEVDVRVTRDGRLVSVHNATVDAYTDGATGKVQHFTLAELQALDIGSRVGPEWKDERIPSMDDVFALCAGRIGIYLDVKDPRSFPELLALVRKHGMDRSALWYTGVQQQRMVQRECPECLPMPDPGPEKNLAALFDRLDPPPRIIASMMKYCSASFVETAHSRGAIVITDEGSKDDWATLLEWGNDGIQTDHPAELIAYLDARPSAAD
jgi:glycerophosphoryl diester phosphodiesterase